MFRISILTFLASTCNGVAVRPQSSSFLQLEPTELQLASMEEISQGDSFALSQSSSTKIDQFGWSALLQPSSLSMVICGSVIMMFVVPMTWLNERKSARIDYVLSRAMAEVSPFQSSTHIKWQ